MTWSRSSRFSSILSRTGATRPPAGVDRVPRGVGGAILGPQLAGKLGELRGTVGTRNCRSEAISSTSSLVAEVPQSVLKTASGATRSWVRIPVHPLSTCGFAIAAAFDCPSSASVGPHWVRIWRNLGVVVAIGSTRSARGRWLCPADCSRFATKPFRTRTTARPYLAVASLDRRQRRTYSPVRPRLDRNNA
jgi:hypothetical protein